MKLQLKQLVEEIKLKMKFFFKTLSENPSKAINKTKPNKIQITNNFTAKCFH
jgi:hypothetical protein